MTTRASGDRRTGAAPWGTGGTSPLRMVMLGPPGAGKGTQADHFARQRGLLRISTGDILREAILGNTEIGRVARRVMEAGQLVSDEIAIAIVREQIERPAAAAGFVLDGFPRTLVQAEALDALLDDRVPLIVVDIEVPSEALVRRIGSRRICRVCGATATAAIGRCAKCGGELVQRTDDDLEVVRERLKVYERDTRPIVEFYRRRPTFRSVDGDQSPDAVSADIAAAVASVVGVPA